MTATTHLIDRERAVLMDTYARQPVAFVSGTGSWLTDAEGVRYLDFLGGLAVVSVGHANPRVRSAVDEQMGRLVHVSNIYLTE
ncbi:MAG: aminotransferase class III-fold pyridoxal phosphate-dependent enzyme, partial [Actinomycetota bacterium]